MQFLGPSISVNLRRNSSPAAWRVPSVRAPGKRGDLYVELHVVVPKPVDEKVRDLLRELAKFDTEDPRRDLFARAGA